MEPLVSVIIPTYNRFKYLLNAIESVKNQTYKNIEIIIINDKSTQPEYYSYEFEGCKIIHLEKNSKEIFGYACAGYVRNRGVRESKGVYLCFLDDDDVFLPHKIETQISEMIKKDYKICATEALIGNGIYNKSKNYPLYNEQYYKDYILNKLNLDSYPNEINLELINKHNIIINSSVMITKELFNSKNGYELINRGEDYCLWKKCLKQVNCLYIKNPCLYYDLNHGNGQLY
jgi:teichuronic acid biosynthesis glycosyltransferase TuaG